MPDNLNSSSFNQKAPLYQLLVSLLIVLVTGILIFSVLLLTGIMLFNADVRLLANPSAAINSNEIAFLKYILIAQDFSFFIIPAIIILRKLNPDYRFSGIIRNIPAINEVILLIILAFCIFPVTSFTGRMNANMELPDWLFNVENWMREKENNANMLISMLMTPQSFSALLINVFMIAVIPAIGEELIFRGVFQQILQKLFRSDHMAVWFTAFVFSAIHFQFFGFIPRFILGLIFGYLFVWGRSLWLPVISHFINNVIPTVGSYIHGWDSVNSPPEISLLQQLPRLLIPLVIGIMIMIFFWNKSSK